MRSRGGVCRGPGRSGARRRDSYRRCALFAVLLWIRCKTRRALVYDIVRYLGAAIIAGLPHPRSISRYRLIDKNPTIVGTVNNTEHRVTMQTSLIWTYQFSITLMSDLHDLTLSIIDLLTIRSPIWRYNYRKIITTVSHSRTVFKWLGPGQSRHVIDRLGRIGLALGKRTVKVIPYRLSFTETCVTQWQTTLTVSALHFSTLWISASSNAHPVCLSWKKNDTWTTDRSIWLTVLRSCMAKGTDNLQSPQRYWNVRKLYRSKYYVIYAQTH